MTTETMTPAEALLWLAGLEKACDAGHPLTDDYFKELGECFRCNSTNKVPVLDLRELCSCINSVLRPACVQCRLVSAGIVGYHSSTCLRCRGRNWIPKQGQDALHQAMLKAGYHKKIEDELVLFFSCRYIPRCSKPDSCGAALIYTLAGFTSKDGPLAIRDSMRGWEERWKEMADTNDWLAAVKAMKAAGYGAGT